jgi:hypothetical protein
MLTDDDLGRVVDDDWTVGALLAHVCFWDRFVLQRWRQADRSGGPTPALLDDQTTDLVNDASLSTWRAITPAAVRGMVAGAMEEVDGHVAGLPDAAIEAIAREGRPRLLDRSIHRLEHLATIEHQGRQAG